MSQNEFQPPSEGPYASPTSENQSQGAAPKTSKLAIFSLVLGVSSLLCSVLSGIVGFILGLVAVFQINGSNGRLNGMGLAIAGMVTSVVFSLVGLILVGMMLPAVQAVRTAARRTQSANNMRQLALASLNYESANLQLPGMSGDAQGRGQGLSWRVHVLPYLEQNELYERFHLDEPWDSPHNKTLIASMPDLFVSAQAVGKLPPGHSIYLRPTGNGAIATPDGQGIKFSSITDGSSNTILVLEADVSEAVPWTKPADYVFDPENPMRGLGEHYPGNGFGVVVCVGSTLTLNANPEMEETIKAAMTKDGGEIVQLY